MMKKLALVALLAFSTLTFSQEKDSTNHVLNKKHELKLGTIKLLSAGIFETTYEYVQNSNTGFGASLLINFDSDNDYFEDYSLTPFYRMYFQKNEDYGAKGFFVEGFTSFFGGNNDFFTGIDEDKFFDISLGITIGKKWINTSGFVFEARFGAGRNLLGNAAFDALFKGDLYIGYRF